MSSVNYFKAKKEDNYSCQGLKCSSVLPNYFFSKQEKLALGIDLTIKEWLKFWKTTNCPAIFNSMIYIEGKYSEKGFQKAVECYNYMFYSYYGPYDEITNKKGGHTISDSDEMSNLLINSCIKNQGVCQCVAYTMCSDCNSLTIHESKLLKKLGGCACIPSTSIQYNLERSCDKDCTSKNVSKTRNYKTGIVDICKRKVCFIDPITGIQFDDQCPHCKDGSCTCIIDEKGHYSNYKDNCNIKFITYSENNCSDDEPTYVKYVFLFILIILILAIIVVLIINNPTETEELGNETSEFNKSLQSQDAIYDSSFFGLNPMYSFNMVPDFTSNLTKKNSKKK